MSAPQEILAPAALTLRYLVQLQPATKSSICSRILHIQSFKERFHFHLMKSKAGAWKRSGAPAKSAYQVVMLPSGMPQTQGRRSGRD
jgi:hypothetical protein